MKSKKKHTLLKGEGANQHTLYGDFKVGEQNEFTDVIVEKDSLLKHEQPDGSFGEHNGLQVEKGNWVTGRQVQYNPFDRKVTMVID